MCAKVIKYIECSDREQTSEYAHKRTRNKNPFNWNERIESSEMVFDKASWRESPRFVVDAAAVAGAVISRLGRSERDAEM